MEGQIINISEDGSGSAWTGMLCMPSPGDGGGVCAGDEAALLRAGELVEALLAARQVVAVSCSHGAHFRLQREHHRGRTYLHYLPGVVRHTYI